jgi:glutamate synthase (NADPH/NADH) small chain
MAQPTVKTQDSERRAKNFSEVSLGFPKKLVFEEARRCPQCVDPVCIKGCPLGINIPKFIRCLREGNVDGAYEIIREENDFPSVCGRICSAPCEAFCILNEEGVPPIGIRALERYAADFGRSKTAKRNQPFLGGKKIAIIGSGPTGLTAASELSQLGYRVTVFESFDKPGGVLRYGIPEFRIPKKTLDNEINEIRASGVKIEVNFAIGHTTTLEELMRQDFAAVLLATGAGIPKFMDLSGANLGGVYYGEEFLMRVNRAKTTFFSRKLDKLPVGQRIAVIGSGNTALDCARIGVRLGREVTLIFRRTEEDMRVKREERTHAKEEGVHFEPMVKPIEVLADPSHFVGGLKCVRMDFADTDGSGEWKLIQVPDSEFVIDVDTVVIAIGNNPNSLISKNGSQFKINDDGTLKVNEKNGMTSVPGVFAAGNVRTNVGPVIRAIASGKEAAQEIDNYLKAKKE